MRAIHRQISSSTIPQFSSDSLNSFSLQQTSHMTVMSSIPWLNHMTVTCSPLLQGIQTPHPPQSKAVVIRPQVLFLLVCEVGLVPVMQ